MKQRRLAASGFTLIEVLIAVVLLSLAVISLGQFMGKFQNATAKATLLSTMTSIAKVLRIRQRRPDGIDRRLGRLDLAGGKHDLDVRNDAVEQPALPEDVAAAQPHRALRDRVIAARRRFPRSLLLDRLLSGG